MKNEIAPPPNEIDKARREQHLEALLRRCSRFSNTLSSQRDAWSFAQLQPFPVDGATVMVFPALMKGDQQRVAATMMQL